MGGVVVFSQVCSQVGENTIVFKHSIKHSRLLLVFMQILPCIAVALTLVIRKAEQDMSGSWFMLSVFEVTPQVGIYNAEHLFLRRAPTIQETNIEKKKQQQYDFLFGAALRIRTTAG